MHKRTKLKKRYQTNKTTQKLIDIELELQQSYTNERRNQEADATSNIKLNPKYFYSYANVFQNTNLKLAP